MNETEIQMIKMFLTCVYSNYIYTDEIYCELKIFSGHKLDLYRFAKFQLCRISVVLKTTGKMEC